MDVEVCRTAKALNQRNRARLSLPRLALALFHQKPSNHALHDLQHDRDEGSPFTFRASFPRSVTLTQLRFSSLTVTSSWRDLHPQEL